MSRRTAIRTTQRNGGYDNFPYIKGDKLVIKNAATGEIINASLIKITPKHDKILVKAEKRLQWIVLSDVVIESDI